MEGKPCEERIEKLFSEIESRFGTIEDFAKAANVPASFLRSLKGAKWDELPEAIYVKAFLKKIAETLGWPEDEVLSIFSDCVFKKQVPIEIREVPVKRSTSFVIPRSFRWIVPLVLVSLLSLWGGFYVYTAKRVGIKKRPSASIHTESETTETLNQSGSYLEANGTENSVKDYEIEVVSVKGRSWFRWISNHSKIQGFILDGATRKFICSYNETCYLKLGRPEAVKVMCAGKSWEFSGKRPVLLRIYNGNIEVSGGRR